MAALADFQFLDGDIVVASYQKGGSIIFRVMVQMLLGLPVMEDRFHWLEIDGNEVKSESYVKGHRLLRTHLPADWLNLPISAHVTFLFAYPTDPDFALSLFSHFHTSKAIDYQGDWTDFFRLWKTGKVFYGSFYKHTDSWLSKTGSLGMVSWGHSRGNIDERLVGRVADALFTSLYHHHDKTLQCSNKNEANRVSDQIALPSSVNLSSCDDMMTLVSEVSEYLTTNNPLTVWKSDLENTLLEEGLEALPLDHRKYLISQTDFYNIEDQASGEQ